MKEKSSSALTLFAAIAANVAIAAIKFVVAAISGSSAMLSEAIHSLVDTADGLLMLAGVRLSRRAPDAAHPFGYGKDLYFWTLIVGILIFSVGGGMSVYEGLHHLAHPREATNWLLNLAVIGAAMLFESGSFFFAWRGFRAYRRSHPELHGVLETIHASKDPTNFVVLLEDGAALIGLLLAALGVTLSHLLGSPVFDGAASIAIGLLLAAVAVLLAVESRGLLLGESALAAVVRSIRLTAQGAPGLARVDRVLTMQLGPDEVLVALDAAFEPGLSTEQLSAAAEGLEGTLRARHPSIKHVYIDVHAVRRGPHETRA